MPLSIQNIMTAVDLECAFEKPNFI